jgi:SAM-dependent methyltransferase
LRETDLLRERYARRVPGRLYTLDPAAYLARQEKERELIGLIRSCGLRPMREKSILDVGCGNGSDLLDLIRLGYQPENLAGCDLLEERAMIARHRLPEACAVIAADALAFPFEQFDIVMQSTVFTSLLDDEYRHALADKMWQVARDGVLWYDFAYDNPRNSDVAGMPLRKVRGLFPEGTFTVKRVTLAPPITRRVTRVHPKMYAIFNSLPLLRTHLLCWIAKGERPFGPRRP